MDKSESTKSVTKMQVYVKRFQLFEIENHEIEYQQTDTHDIIAILMTIEI